VKPLTPIVEAVLRASGCGESVEDVYEERGITSWSVQRADWLLRHRSVVVEFKELAEDCFSGKIADVVRPYAADLGMSHGFIDINPVVRAHPHGARLSRDIDEVVTDVLRGDIEEANSQIRATKKALKLNAALGLVVVFNSANAVLSERHTSVAMNRQLLRARDRFESVNATAVLNPYLEVTAKGADGRLPFFVYAYPSHARARAADAAKDICVALNAKFGPSGSNVPIVSGDSGMLPIRQRFGEPVIAPKGTEPAEIIRAKEAARKLPQPGVAT